MTPSSQLLLIKPFTDLPYLRSEKRQLLLGCICYGFPQIVHMFTCTDIDAQDYILLRDGAPDIIYGPHLRYDFKNRDDDGRISEGETRRAVVHTKRVPSNLGHVPAYFKLPHQLILRPR